MGEPWYRTLFDGFYYDVWFRRGASDRGDPACLAAEVDFIVDTFDLEPGASVLDLCCGHGRHTVELARRGYRLTGLDLSPRHLALARQAAEDVGVTAEWIEADMRDVPHGPFDAVVNMFSAFGYLESDAEDQKVIDGIAGALRPGGRFLSDVRNREQAIRTFRPYDWQPLADGSAYLMENEIDLPASRWRVRNTLIEPDGRRTSADFSVRQYTLTELTRMLAAAGLAVTGTWGGFDGSPYTIETARMILRADLTPNTQPERQGAHPA